MSNLSLKEQLKALSLTKTHALEETKKEKKKINQLDPAKKKAPRQKPAWLERAQYGVELLKAHFPNCFKEHKNIQPLKIGIKQDLAKNLSAREDIVLSDKACMVSSLAYYVNSVAYHRSMLEGAARIDLMGNPTGMVTTEESQYSIECRKAKLQKKQGTAITTTEDF